MEIDNNQLIELNNRFIFKPDYKGSNITKNIKFLNWKELMLKKFGEKSNYFYCKKDEIFYWVDYNTIKRYIYFVACPICKYRICQFCSSTYHKYRICCLKRKIYSLLFVGGPSYLKNEYIFEGSYLYCILIPGLSFVSISIQIKHILKCDGGEPSFLEAYDSCKIISEGMLFIILSIPFFIINTYFLIILILISIVFKFAPLKFFFGALDLNDLIFPRITYIYDIEGY